MTLGELKELLYRHGNAAVSRQKYLDTTQTCSRQYYYDRVVYDIETEILDHDAALRATIQQMAEQIERLTAERGEAEQREQRLREALTPLASGEQWGKWKAWVVEGALRREAGIEAAKHITQLQVAAQEALESSPSPQGGDAPHRER